MTPDTPPSPPSPPSTLPPPTPPAGSIAGRGLFRGITRNVVVLGVVSLLTDLASEMLYPIIPLFVTGVLKATPAQLGAVEGVAEGISTGLRWIGGVLSDLARKRKPFVVAGYGISALSKPIMGLAAWVGGLGMFLSGRASDRLGKSIRTAARDALIAEATAPEYRGAAFGLHRAMDTTGAILGPLAAMAILFWGPEDERALAWLFVVALLPGLASALLALLAVRDIPHERAPDEARRKARFFQAFPAAFFVLLAANAIFSLGNSSDSLLILRSSELMDAGRNWTLAQKAIWACGLFAVFNTVYALAAAPLGKLSDIWGRKPVIVCGWLVYAAVYFGFAAWPTAAAPWVLFASYGLYQALAEGVSKALVSDLVPREMRAGAIGLFYTVSGLGQLVASLTAGMVWDVRLAGGRVMLTFLLGTLCALAAVPVLLAVRTPRQAHA